MATEKSCRNTELFSTSDGLAMLMKVQGRLTHAEFRLLFALSDGPVVGGFRIKRQSLLDSYGFSDSDLDAAEGSLDRLYDDIGTVFYNADFDAFEWVLTA